MEANNFDRTLIAFRERKPFQPFTVALVNGDRFEVDSPNALVVRDGVAIYIAPGGFPIIFDHEGVNQLIVVPEVRSAGAGVAARAKDFANFMVLKTCGENVGSAV